MRGWCDENTLTVSIDVIDVRLLLQQRFDHLSLRFCQEHRQQGGESPWTLLIGRTPSLHQSDHTVDLQGVAGVPALTNYHVTHQLLDQFFLVGVNLWRRRVQGGGGKRG